MTGQSCLIIKDLKNSMPIKLVSDKYSITQSAVYQLAKKYSIPMREISEKERKDKKKLADAKRNEEKRIRNLLDPKTEMPQCPMTAAKLGALSSLNAAWITGQGNKRSSIKEHKATQARYGLRT